MAEFLWYLRNPDLSTVQYTILYSTLESPFKRYQNNTAMYIWCGCTSPGGEINFGLEGEYSEGQHHRGTDTNRHQHLVERHLYVECHNVCEPADPGQGEVIIG